MPTPSNTPTIPTLSRAEGPRIGTWISIDRASPAQTRSYSEVLYAAPFTEPVTVYKTGIANASRSTFVTGLSVAADGQLAFIVETSTDLTATPNRCTKRMLSIDVHGTVRPIAQSSSPGIPSDFSVFTSVIDDACEATRLRVRELVTNQQRDFEMSDFTGLLTRQTDLRYARVGGATWSPDGRWLAASFGTPEDWFAMAVIDTQDWSLRLVRPDDALARRLETIFGPRGDMELLSTSAIGWTTDGALALRIGCYACPPYEYALLRIDAIAALATEPTLPGNVKPAASVWLGTFEGWTLVADRGQVVATSDTKRVVLFEGDGFVLNPRWPEGTRTLPAST